MREFKKSSKLNGVCYDIRGPVLQEAKRLEDEGFQILKLNTGNPPPFGINAPDEIIHDLIANLKSGNTLQAYSDSKGLFSARKAIMQYCQTRNIAGFDIEDIFTGNGVSELIVMAMQALLDDNDEILIPAPDYPLWTASVRLSGGKAVHYICDEQADWLPDISDIKRKISRRTKGIVVINPNNPTGALYPRDLLEQIVELARRHSLIIFSDEIYDKIVYDGHEHIAMASLADDVFFVTFNGLSKTYRVPGFRAGWMVLSGMKKTVTDYIEGLNILATMRLCSNVPAQAIIQTALGGKQSIYEFTAPGGRLYEQREVCFRALTEIEGVTCVKPKAALYMFPKLDIKKFNISSDQQFALDLVRSEKILIVQGSGFNWPHPDHFRIVFLPSLGELVPAMNRIKVFLSTYRQE